MDIHASEPVFVLRLVPQGDGYALVDSIGHVRAASPNKDLLAANVPEIADACITAANMRRAHVKVGQIIAGTVPWAIRL